MKEQPVRFTPEGIKAFTAELEQLKKKREEKRRADPKADVSFFDKRIGELNTLMEGATVFGKPQSEDVVETGAFVKLRDTEFHEDVEYRVVNRFEADPLTNKCSEESPIGRALAGRKVGDQITVETTGGSLTYEILAVEYRNT
jgi:transcription elongation factor GreA